MTIRTGELAHLVIEEIWNRGDVEMADALFTDDYVNHGGLILDVVRGPEAIKISAVLYRRAFPTFYVVVDELSSEGDAIVLRWVARRGPPPVDGHTNKKGGLRGITRCRLRDGKIAESWMVWDSRAALVQLAPAHDRRSLPRRENHATTSKRPEKPVRREDGIQGM